VNELFDFVEISQRFETFWKTYASLFGKEYFKMIYKVCIVKNVFENKFQIFIFVDFIL
jgi:hypothetical protein